MLTDGTPPLLKLLTAKTQNALKQKGIVVEVSTNEAARITASVSLAVPATGKSSPRTYRMRPMSKSLGAGQGTKLNLKFGAPLMKVIAAALKQGKLKATVRVTAADGAGNRTTRTLKVTLKR